MAEEKLPANWWGRLPGEEKPKPPESRPQRIGERVYAASDVEARDAALRELLSYCTIAEQYLAESAVGAPNPAIAEQSNRARWAYADVRDKLAKILDGES